MSVSSIYSLGFGWRRNYSRRHAKYTQRPRAAAHVAGPATAPAAWLVTKRAAGSLAGALVTRRRRRPPAGPSPYAQGVRLPPRTPFPAEKEVSAPRLPFSRGRPTATLPGGASSSTAFPPPIQSTPGRGGGEIDDGRSIAQPERRRDAVDGQTDRPAGRGGRVRSRCDGAPLLLRRPWRRASGCADVPGRGVPGQEEHYRRRPVCPAHQWCLASRGDLSGPSTTATADGLKLAPARPGGAPSA